MTSHAHDSPTARLGQYVSATAGAPSSRNVADKAAFCLLDALGLALLATDETTFRAARSTLVRLDPGLSGAARVWSDGSFAPASDATLVNAIAVHAQFHDDSDNSSWSHPGSFVIPAAVAAAELTDASLERLLAAIAIGYGAVEWLGADEVVARALITRGIRTTPTLGTIGAAAAASAVLGLDASQARSAVGMASSITGGVLEPVGCGSDEWRLQAAQAARGGLVAAQLAQRGVQGAPAGLEGRRGLLRAMAGLSEIPSRWENPPRADGILDTCAKPLATLGDNMSVAIAAQLARKEIADISAIRRIRVTVWRHYAEYPGTDYAGPFETIVQAIASMRFAAAAMLAHGVLEYDIPSNHRDDPDILSLVPLVEIIPDDDGGPYDAIVAVELADGTIVEKNARDAPRTLLFHDRSTSRGLIEDRMTRSGRAAGSGHRLADTLFAAIDSGRWPNVRACFDLI